MPTDDTASDRGDTDESVDELQYELARLHAENEQLQSRLRIRSVLRSVSTGALVVVTSLMLVASTVAVWGNRTVFDTDRFMGVIDPALEDPAFYDTLSRNVSEQVLTALDLETRVRARLTQLDDFLAQELVDALDVPPAVRSTLSRFDRPTLADLTPSIVDPLEQRVDERITGFITSDGFRQRLPLLVERAHAATLALIDGDLADYPNVYVADGAVRLNLIPIIVDALQPAMDTLLDYLPDISLPQVVSNQVDEGRAQLAEALGTRLPDDFGQLTIISEDSLSTLQDGARTIDRATWLLVIVTVVLVLATLLAAANRRRAVIWLAIGVTSSLAVSWWVITRIRDAVLDQIVAPDSREAVRALLRETTASFRTYVIVVLVMAIVAGLAAIVVAHLDDLARTGRWVRQQVGDEPTPVNEWATAHYDLLRVAAFVVAGLALLVTGITTASFLVIGSLLGLGLLVLAALRRDVPPVDPATSEP